MITDDRLKELLTVGGANSAPMHEISEMAELILSLRSQVKALVEDGERLAKELEGAIFVIDEFPIDYSNGITWNGIDEGRVRGAEMEHKMREDGHKALDQHAALLKDLE